MICLILLFLTVFSLYGAEKDSTTNNFGNIVAKLPRSFVNIPYDSCPLWCSDNIDEEEPGQILEYKKLPDGPFLYGFLTECGDVRVAVAKKTNTKINQVYRVLTFKRNSKGVWYQNRDPVQIWLVKRKGFLTCLN